MGDLEAAGAVAVTLKSAFDLSKSIVDLAGGGKLAEHAGKLQAQILAAQSTAMDARAAQSDLIDEKRRLEAKLAEFERWDAEKERYQLEEVVDGCFAYAIKPSAAGVEPLHKICAHCYQKRKKSILFQHTLDIGRAVVLRCDECKTQFAITGIIVDQKRRPR